MVPALFVGQSYINPEEGDISLKLGLYGDALERGSLVWTLKLSQKQLERRMLGALH